MRRGCRRDTNGCAAYGLSNPWASGGRCRWAYAGTRRREAARSLRNLLLRRNEVVPSDRLLEDLYGSVQPATAHKSLQAHVSRLRKLLDPDRLRTRGSGYVLEARADEVDADRFVSLLDEGRALLMAGDPKRAERPLEQALALWRGSPLDDVAYEEFAQAEIARLEELRIACLEALCEARLALGRHAELVSELEWLVAEHPHRERLRGTLMLALYRSGRQADALAAYRERAASAARRARPRTGPRASGAGAGDPPTGA